jgi:hypothetical protein
MRKSTECCGRGGRRGQAKGNSANSSLRLATSPVAHAPTRYTRLAQSSRTRGGTHTAHVTAVFTFQYTNQLDFFGNLRNTQPTAGLCSHRVLVLRDATDCRASALQAFGLAISATSLDISTAARSKPFVPTAGRTWDTCSLGSATRPRTSATESTRSAWCAL